MKTRRAIGAAHEEDAAAHLAAAGLQLVERNVSCRYGEIDLVLRDRDVLVFAEVRYRSGSGHGGALESVDTRKRGRLVGAARWYLLTRPQYADWPCRFDVIAIDGATRPFAIQWIRDAFRVDG
jgi:putative endonuclease